MSLEVAKLKRVRELAGGIMQARCPACAEGGHDGRGEHLRIYPDGRFGCCVHPKDKEHRKRIFALAGVKGRLPFSPSGTFTLRVKTPPALAAARSVKAALVMPLHPSPDLRPPSPASAGEGLGTLGTGKTESENGVPGVPSLSGSLAAPNSGTLGTPIFNPRAYAREESANVHTPVYMCKDLESGVPSVPSVPRSSGTVATELPPTAAPGDGPSLRLPFLTPGGTLVIPFDSPERYHWWKPDGDRLTVAETLAEVLAGRASASGTGEWKEGRE